MSTRWFYILIANVVVLTANVWLFVDKSKPEPEIAVAVTPLNPIITAPIQLVGKPKELGILSINGFHFWLNDPLAVQNDDLTPQLNSANKVIAQKDGEIKKAQQKTVGQSRQINALEKSNNKLRRQLFLLETELEHRDERLAQNKQTIIQLESSKKTPSEKFLKTDRELLKKSIQSKPDLVTLKPAKKSTLQTEAIDKEAFIDEVEEKRFSGSVEFGFNYEQDNQVTKSIKGRLVLDYDKSDKYNINSDLDFEFENEDGETSTEKYRWQLQSDYNLDPINLIYARSDVSRSQFSSYKQEDIFTVGYGRIFFNTTRHKFNAEVGPGYRFSVPNAGKDAVSIDEFIVRTRLNYERIITDSLQVKMDAVVEAGHSNSVYNLNFKAQNRLYQELYLIFDFGYKYTENVPVDTVNEEVFSGLSLLYAF